MDEEFTECPGCNLNFYVVYANDYSAMNLGEYPDQFCPRCGEELGE